MTLADLGALLRYHRREALLNQKELAARLQYNHSFISRMEKGNRCPPPDYLDRFAAALLLPPADQEELRRLYLQAVEPAPQRREDWREAPLADAFYGRQRELAVLSDWIMTDKCRLIGVLGMGGIGKTALVAKLARQLAPAFECVVWRSLINAPSLSALLEVNLPTLLGSQTGLLPESLDQRLRLFQQALDEQRCLVILDNMEAILEINGRAGHYRPGYEDYGQLLQRVGTSQHHSCLIVTGREKPKEFALLEEETGPVRTWRVGCLSEAESRRLLHNRHLSGSDQDWQALVSHYSGNPMALKIVAETIRELFGGGIAALFEAEIPILDDIRRLLDEQFARLSPQEQAILYWLAVEREAVSLARLRSNLLRPQAGRNLPETMHHLQRRSLVETYQAGAEPGFALQNVVMEYVTDRLISQICAEIETNQIDLLNSHGLSLAQSKEYVRESQLRLLIRPIAGQLLATYGRQGLQTRLLDLLSSWRGTGLAKPGYLAANILHLLIYLGYDLRGCDFSGLAIRQAFLQNVELPAVDFSQADLTDSLFLDNFEIVLSLNFSPDGRLLAAGVGAYIRLWEAASGRPLTSYEGHTHYVWSVRFSPDGRLLASGSSDQTVRLWDLTTGRCLHHLTDHHGGVRSVAFSPTGRLLASSSIDQTIRFWEVATGTCLQVLKGHTDTIWSVAYSPDGQHLASTGDDGTVRLWNVASGECLRILNGHQGWVRVVVYSPEGRYLASGGDDRLVRVWEVASGRQITALAGHTDRIRAIIFSADGRTLISGGDDQTIRVWDWPAEQTIRIWQEHTNQLRSIVLSPDNKLLASGGEDQTARLRDAHSGQCLKTLQGYFPKIWSVLAFNPAGTTLAACAEDRLIWLWDLTTGRLRTRLAGHTSRVRTVAYHPSEELLASAGVDLVIRLWDALTGVCLREYHGHQVWIRAIAFHPAGTMLASGSQDRTIRLWDLTAGRCLQTLLGHQREITTIAFSRDGRHLASGSASDALRIWEVQTGQCLHTLPDPASRANSLTFSGDGQHVISAGDDQTIRLWSVETGECRQVLQGQGRILAVAVNPTGSLIATGSTDQTLRLWSAVDGRCINVLTGHSGVVRSLSFSPDGATLASGSHDETIKLWDPDRGLCLMTLKSDRPYEGLKISGATGLTPTQQATLKSLGAVE